MAKSKQNQMLRQTGFWKDNRHVSFIQPIHDSTAGGLAKEISDIVEEEPTVDTTVIQGVAGLEMILQDIYAGTLRLTERLRESELAREAAEEAYRDLISRFTSVKKDFELCTALRQSLEHEVEALKASQKDCTLKIDNLLVQESVLRESNVSLNMKISDLEKSNRSRTENAEIETKARILMLLTRDEESRNKVAGASAIRHWREWKNKKRRRKSLAERAMRYQRRKISGIFNAWIRCLQNEQIQLLCEKNECTCLIISAERITRFVRFWAKILLKTALALWFAWKSFRRKKRHLSARQARIYLNFGRTECLARWTEATYMSQLEKKLRAADELQKELISALELNKSNEKCMDILLRKQQEMKGYIDEQQSSHKASQQYLENAHTDVRMISAKYSQYKESSAAARVHAINYMCNKLCKWQHLSRWKNAVAVARRKEHLRDLVFSRYLRGRLEKFLYGWLAYLREQKKTSLEMQHMHLEQEFEQLQHLYKASKDSLSAQQKTTESIASNRSIVRIMRVVAIINKLAVRSFIQIWFGQSQWQRSIQRLLRSAHRKDEIKTQCRFFCVWTAFEYDRKLYSLTLRQGALEQELIEAVKLKISAESRMTSMLEQQSRIELASTEHRALNQELVEKIADADKLLEIETCKHTQYKLDLTIQRICGIVKIWNRKATADCFRRWHDKASKIFVDRILLQRSTEKRRLQKEAWALFSWSAHLFEIKSSAARSEAQVLDEKIALAQARILTLENETSTLRDQNARDLEAILSEKRQLFLEAAMNRITRVVVFWKFLYFRKAIRAWCSRVRLERRWETLCQQATTKSSRHVIQTALLLWTKFIQEKKEHSERLNAIALEQKLVAIADIKESNEVSMISMVQLQRQMELAAQEAFRVRTILERKLQDAENEIQFIIFRHQREKMHCEVIRISKFVHFWNIALQRHILHMFIGWFVRKQYLRHVMRIGLRKLFRQNQSLFWNEWKWFSHQRKYSNVQKHLLEIRLSMESFFGTSKQCASIDFQESSCIGFENDLKMLNETVTTSLERERQSRTQRSYCRIVKVILLMNIGLVRRAFRRALCFWATQRRILRHKKQLLAKRKRSKCLSIFMTGWIHVYLKATRFFVRNFVMQAHSTQLKTRMQSIALASESLRVFKRAKPQSYYFLKFWAVLRFMQLWRDFLRMKIKRRCLSIRGLVRHLKASVDRAFTRWVVLWSWSKSFQVNSCIKRLRENLSDMIAAKNDTDAQIAFLLEARRQAEASEKEILASRERLESELAASERHKQVLDRRQKEEAIKKNAARVLAMWTNASLFRAWNRWHDQVTTAVRHRHQMKLCLVKMSVSVLAKTYFAWMQVWEESHDAEAESSSATKPIIGHSVEISTTRIFRFVKLWSRYFCKRTMKCMRSFADLQLKYRIISRKIASRYERNLLGDVFYEVKHIALADHLKKRIIGSQEYQDALSVVFQLKRATFHVMRFSSFWCRRQIAVALNSWIFWFLGRRKRRRQLLKGEWFFERVRNTRCLQSWVAQVHHLKIRANAQTLAEVKGQKRNAESRSAALLDQVSHLRDLLTNAEFLRTSTMALLEDQKISRSVSRILRVIKFWRISTLKHFWTKLRRQLTRTCFRRRVHRHITAKVLQQILSTSFIAWREYRANTQQARSTSHEDRLIAATELKAEKAQSDIAFLVNQLKIVMRVFRELSGRMAVPVGPTERSITRDIHNTKADLGRWKDEAEVLRLEAQWQSTNLLALL